MSEVCLPFKLIVMKKIVFIIPILLFFVSCGTTKKTNSETTEISKEMSAEVKARIEQRDDAFRNEGVDFLAIGDNPEWILTINGEEQLLMINVSGKEAIRISLSDVDHINYVDMHVLSGGDEVQLISKEEETIDRRTGEVFPYKVTVNYNGQTYVGFGKELKMAEESIAEVPMQLNDIWALIAVDGKEIDLSNKDIYQPSLQLNLKKKEAIGLTDCNNFQTKFIIEGDKISFPPFAMTRRYCEGYENVFVKGIGNTASYKLDGMTLYFYDKDGKEVLRFKKVD
jgi:heat shock protein HslJ